MLNRVYLSVPSGNYLMCAFQLCLLKSIVVYVGHQSIRLSFVFFVSVGHQFIRLLLVSCRASSSFPVVLNCRAMLLMLMSVVRLIFACFLQKAKFQALLIRRVPVKSGSGTRVRTHWTEEKAPVPFSQGTAQPEKRRTIEILSQAPRNFRRLAHLWHQHQ